MNENKKDDSLLENLKAAGASISGVVSDFAGRFREDSSEAALLERLKEAAADARTRLSGANGGEEIKAATADFASNAESIVRELFASMREAASGTRDSESFNQARGFVSETIGTVRGSVDEAVTKVRKETPETGPEDPQADLDNLMNNLRGDADIIDGEVVDDTTNDGK